MVLLFMGTAFAQTSTIPKLFFYDDFHGKYINPLKWSSQWMCGTSTVMECERNIEGGHLALHVRNYGDNVENQGMQFGNSLLYLNVDATDISTDVTVQSAKAQSCPANPGGAHAQVLLSGHFFSDGGLTWDNDMIAFLQLDHYPTDPGDEVEVGGFLQYQGQFFANVYLGPAKLGDRINVELKWDQPNHQFVVSMFQPRTGTITEALMPYEAPEIAPPVFPYKGLSANAFSPNCTSGVTFADSKAYFDNVRTNVPMPTVLESRPK